MMKRIKILLFLLLFSCAAQGQTPSWVTDWYTHLNNTMINGPANGGTRTYVAGLFDSVVAKIWQQTRIKVSYTDTQAMLQNYAIEAQMLGYLGLKLDIDDSVSAYYTVYGVDTAKAAIRGEIALRELLSNKVISFASPNNTTYPTTAAVNSLVGSYKLKSDSTATSGYVTHYQNDTGKQNIRDEIAALPIPFYGDSIKKLYDTAAAHNTRLLVWEHSEAYGIGAADVGNWNTAYSNRITSLTTSGSSGAATLISNTLNIPQYTLSGLGGLAATTTSVNTVPITSGINNTVTASALTLTTTTLNPTVVTSSLTSVATITAGTWSSTIGSAATGSTQAVNNNSTQIATTAYVDRYFPVDTTISAAYTLTSRDFHRTIHCTNGSNIALTIPTGLGTTFECVVLAEGAGTVTPTTSSTTFYYQPTSTTKIKSQGGATIRSWATANSYLIIGSLE